MIEINWSFFFYIYRFSIWFLIFWVFFVGCKFCLIFLWDDDNDDGGDVIFFEDIFIFDNDFVLEIWLFLFFIFGILWLLRFCVDLGGIFADKYLFIDGCCFCKEEGV